MTRPAARHGAASLHSAAATAAFIRANTTLGRPPLLPEIRIYLARDAIELWERTEQQTGRAELPPPFWAFPWAGGQALARYLLDHPGQVRGRTVLDFAAGSGLVAIAAARAGAAAVQAAETDPLAIAAIQLNASVNRVQVDATLGDLLDGPPPAVDLVLAGDVFYERAFAGRLLPWLAQVRAAGIEALVGDPGQALPARGSRHRGGRVPGPGAPRPGRRRRQADHRLAAPLSLGAQRERAAATTA